MLDIDEYLSTARLRKVLLDANLERPTRGQPSSLMDISRSTNTSRAYAFAIDRLNLAEVVNKCKLALGSPFQ